MTRWSESDLIGHIEDQELKADPDWKDPFPWVTVNLPAIAEHDEPPYRKAGEALWPSRYSVEDLKGIRQNVTEHWWNAQYMGSPTPDDGLIFRKEGYREWFQGNGCYRLKQKDDTYREVSEDSCIRFITVDLAVSEKQNADYTVMSVWASTPTRDLILIDCVRSHMTAPDKIPTMQRLKDQYNVSYIAIERFGYQLETIQNARFAGLPIHESAMKGDKVAKTWEASAKWESGQIFFPGNASYTEELLTELYSFPHGKHDDFTDSMSIAAAELSRMGNPMEALGVVTCHKCGKRFVRNARVGIDRPCISCGAKPETPAIMESHVST
jgi:predicted phage terminase large subunit-like protein